MTSPHSMTTPPVSPFCPRPQEIRHRVRLKTPAVWHRKMTLPASQLPQARPQSQLHPPSPVRQLWKTTSKVLLFKTSPPKTSAAAQTTSLQRQQSVCHNRRQSRRKHQQQSINPTSMPPVALRNWVSPVTQKTRQSLTSFRAGDKKTALQRTTIRLPHSRNCCDQKQLGRQKDNAKQRRHQRRHRNMQQRQLRYHSGQPRNNNIQKRQSIHTGRNLIIITTQRRRRNLQRMTSTPMLWKTHRPNQRQQLTRHQRQRATPQPRHSRHVTHPGNPRLPHKTHAPK